ncbi:Daunorubicin/doxorubicin resistance ABC transporter permease protein DrrB [Streptomyces xanthophaeus]|nr:Daunorubicin/doxorubicin resistance ABC transporter permease protein DrrB [Streptomyces xanthophaeus]
MPLMLVGLALGWRIETGVPGAAGAFGVLMLFRFATAWVGTYLGLLSRSEEAAGRLGAATFVLPMLPSAYLPTAGLPGRLRTVAEWNPISAVAGAVRALCANAGAEAAPGAAWPAAHPVAGALLWSALLLAVFVPPATRRFARGRG